jgi:hypothetical protein
LAGIRAQFGHELVEVIGGLEVLVDAGKAHIGHGVDPGEAFHHDLADHLRGDVGFAHAFQPPHDARDHLVDALGFDRALLHGDADRAFQLGAVEILALAA